MATRKSQSTGKSTKSPRKAVKRTKRATIKTKRKGRKRVVGVCSSAAVQRSPKKRTAAEMHTSRCSVCKSAFQADIEARVKDWEPLISIAGDYPGISRFGLDRHAKATGLYRERDKNRKGRLRRLINEAHQRGIRIETGSELIRAMELEARQHGDLVEKLDVSGSIIFKSDDELADRLNNIVAIGKATA